MENIIFFFISIILNSVIAISGFLPSIPITALNVHFFGAWGGFWVSLIGEIVGCWVSFIIYRRFFYTKAQKTIKNNSKIEGILNSSTMGQMRIIFIFRLIPYLPSGLVTMGGAVSSIKTKWFTLSSSIGKIPSLIIEILFVYGAFQLNLPIWVWIIAILAFIVYIYYEWKRANNE